MKLWIASSDEAELKDAHAYPITGVITNPSVIAGIGKNYITVIQSMDDVSSSPIHIQVLKTDEQGAWEDFQEFRQLVSKNRLIVKLPIYEGTIKVMPKIIAAGYECNVTAIVSFSQALIALEAGASYLSVYVGRVSDNGGDGYKLVEEIRNYIDRNNYDCELLAASIRNVEQLERIAKCGAHSIAIPYDLLKTMYQHPLTDSSQKKFEEDWENIS